MGKKLTSILISCGLLIGLHVTAETGAIAASNSTSSVNLSSITATFQQAEYATHYTVHASDNSGRALSYKWTLALQLVDKAGAANSGTPGSKAAVDPSCNNSGKLSSASLEFIWKHGDASLGACDHSKMGPSGHQGRVTVVVSDGVWACTAYYNGTNSGVGVTSKCAQIVSKAKTATVSCQGPTIKLFDNSNGGGVLGGGKQPSFITNGASYCVMQIVTYHWNNGQGAKPGTIGLNGAAGVKLGPWTATGSAGQANAVNVNWTANVSTPTKPVVINGAYSCVDSDPATWSQDAETHGTGFCQVYVEKAAVSAAVASAKPKGSKKPTPKPTTKTKVVAAVKCKGAKLSLKANPDNGNPPLKVIFAMCSPKSVQWRIDYGDGQSKVAIGTPPTSITHTYSKAGGFRPRLTTIASQAATSSTSVTTSVSVGAQLINMTANPASGASPLRVTFGLGTSVVNISTWTLDFGDGTHTGGGGKPPSSVVHSYAKDGSFKATFSVKPGAYALVYTVAQITVGAGTPPILGINTSPTSGTHPLTVKFTIGTTIPGVIVSWVMKFGDGSQQSGQGKPPTSVSHTYTKKGGYLAFLLVSQQQQYGGVQYVVPRNGLAIQVK